MAHIFSVTPKLLIVPIKCYFETIFFILLNVGNFFPFICNKFSILFFPHYFYSYQAQWTQFYTSIKIYFN